MDRPKLVQKYEIYALVVQGMVALNKNDDFQALYVAWMCTVLQNNKMLCNNPKSSGVDGRLSAISTDKSMEYRYNGISVGYAVNENLVKYYCQVFKVEHIAMLHPFQTAIYEEEAAELREIYDYEWTDEET